MHAAMPLGEHLEEGTFTARFGRDASERFERSAVPQSAAQLGTPGRPDPGACRLSA
jgi:hypothetical protein